MSPPLNVILFGQTGSGKSSLINLMAGQDVAKVSSGAAGCTLSFQLYPFLVNGRNVQIWDTVGLDEPDMELESIEKAYRLIRDWETHGGVDLLLFCIRAPRITATSQANYRLFYEALCRSQVPIALAITHLEQEDDMEGWWTRNVERLEQYGLNFAAHVCVTGLPMHSKYPESRKRIWNLLQAHCGERFTMPSEAWFVESLPLLSLFSPLKRGLTRKMIIKVLVKRCGMEQRKQRSLRLNWSPSTIVGPDVQTKSVPAVCPFKIVTPLGFDLSNQTKWFYLFSRFLLVCVQTPLSEPAAGGDMPKRRLNLSRIHSSVTNPESTTLPGTFFLWYLAWRTFINY